MAADQVAVAQRHPIVTCIYGDTAKGKIASNGIVRFESCHTGRFSSITAILANFGKAKIMPK